VAADTSLTGHEVAELLDRAALQRNLVEQVGDLVASQRRVR
jgi:hypothetical protein